MANNTTGRSVCQNGSVGESHVIGGAGGLHHGPRISSPIPGFNIKLPRSITFMASSREASKSNGGHHPQHCLGQSGMICGRNDMRCHITGFVALDVHVSNLVPCLPACWMDACAKHFERSHADWCLLLCSQLYIDGEFVGGADIVEQMQGNGELPVLLKKDK